MVNPYRKFLLIFVVLALVGLTYNANAEIIITKETARGEYENGVYTRGKPEFGYRFVIDEKAGKARLTEVVRLKDNSIIQQEVDYLITAMQDSAASSSFLLSEGRRGQKIITLFGKPGTLATEVLLLGENFFEYCKASSGRLYLSTGTVKRSITQEEDTLNNLMK